MRSDTLLYNDWPPSLCRQVIWYSNNYLSIVAFFPSVRPKHLQTTSEPSPWPWSRLMWPWLILCLWRIHRYCKHAQFPVSSVCSIDEHRIALARNYYVSYFQAQLTALRHSHREWIAELSENGQMGVSSLTQTRDNGERAASAVNKHTLMWAISSTHTHPQLVSYTNATSMPVFCPTLLFAQRHL